MNSPGEAFQLEYYLKSDYIHARITADSIDRALWQSLLSDVLLECARHRRKKLLLERVNATEVVQNELSNMMADLLNMNDETQIAFFNRHLLFAHEIADVVAYGAGMGGNYRCFNTFEAAERWLLQSES